MKTKERGYMEVIDESGQRTAIKLKIKDRHYACPLF